MPGFVPSATGGYCTECPADTYLPLFGSQSATCLPCPANETTWGQTGKSKCGCATGFVRQSSGVCAPCPASFYCKPCTEDDIDCPSEEAYRTPCFSGATTLPGASTVQQCFCSKPGTVGVIQPGISKLMPRAHGQAVASP